MDDTRTFSEKVSDVVAKFGGSWTFIFSAILASILWIGLNTFAYFSVISWDKYPFILLNLFLSFIAAFQAPFIMMSQKRCEIKQDVAYRLLFAEIKELVKTDLEVEQELGELLRQQNQEIIELKLIVQELRKKDQQLEDMVEQAIEDGEFSEE